MQSSYNCTGNLASEPMYFEGDPSRVVFTLAIDRNSKTADGKKKVDFIDFVAWRSVAEYVHKYCHKGDMLSIQNARPQKREVSHDDGSKDYKIEFHVESLDMVRRAKNNWEDNG